VAALAPIVCDTRYVGISLTELTDCVEPHAPFRAGQLLSFGEGYQGVLNGRESWARPFQLHADGVNAPCDVHREGLQKQRPLITEGVVHALPTDVHDAHQVVGGWRQRLASKKGLSPCEELSRDRTPSVEPCAW